MRRRNLHIFLLFSMLLSMTQSARAQFDNEWIDHARRYYRFRVGEAGLHRIPYASLAAAGLGTVPAEQFQLWRMGKQIPLMVSRPTGALGSSDFLEFYGEPNDGSLDTRLYTGQPQPSDKISLFTDSAAYFLTIDPSGKSLRMTPAQNDLSGILPDPEPYFLHTREQIFRNRLHPGFGVNLGLMVYSSSFEAGEGWASLDILPGSPLSQDMGPLHIAPNGPAPTYRLSAFGNATNARTLRLLMNGEDAGSHAFSGRESRVFTGSFPLSLLGKSSDVLTVLNNSTVPSDHFMLHSIGITYPRRFHFGGQDRFRFSLPATQTGQYLEIEGFLYGNMAPVLYDLTEQKMYNGDMQIAGKIRFRMPPGQARDLVLLSRVSSSIRTIDRLQVRQFTDYTKPDRQGDYLIISHARLAGSTGDGPLEDYRRYRSSSEGGGFQARIYDIEELTDQFAYGVKQHPLAIRQFVRFARARFASRPRAVFLIGKGLTYDQFRINESKPSTSSIALVPTFGNPGSDNWLMSEGTAPVAALPVGRLSVVHASEIGDYLEKVREYEAAARTGAQTLQDRGWMKNVVHAVGGSDNYLQSLLFGYMNASRSILADTLFGANVKTFSNNPAFATQQLNDQQLKSLFSEGIGLLNYMGHSSASALEFNIADPYAYDNAGKYPMFVVNGCNAGNFFLYDTTRFSSSNQTLSEKYVMAKRRGSIGFVASTHYGVVNYLNIFVNALYTSIAGTGYGKPMGEVQATALQRLLQTVGGNDYLGRMHAEQITLHGDPMIKLYAHEKPDYVVEATGLRIEPMLATAADGQVSVDIRMQNIGKAVGDSIRIRVSHQRPDGSKQDILYRKMPAIRWEDSLTLKIPVNPLTDKGENRVTVTIDADDRYAELSESNNSISKTYTVIEDELRPVWPGDLTVMNVVQPVFLASTADPLLPARRYLMEVDTSAAFSSPARKTVTINAPGGLLKFQVPGLTLSDGTVYYWRTAPEPAAGESPRWNRASFQYARELASGFAQAHYHQHVQSATTDMRLDTDRVWRFNDRPAQIVIKTGIFPVYPKNRINVQVDEKYHVLWGCRPGSLQIVVYDGISLMPMRNAVQPGGKGLYGSWAPCQYNDYLFEFPYDDPGYRRSAMDFLDSLPAGSYVSITNMGSLSNTRFVDDWMADTIVLGAGKSLYHSLVRLGMSDIDRFKSNVPFLFFRRLGDASVPIISQMGASRDEFIEKRIDVRKGLDRGMVNSPWFGPVRRWDAIRWMADRPAGEQDRVAVDVIGRDNSGLETSLATLMGGDTSLSFVDASRFPYLRLRLRSIDSLGFTPAQLRFWRLAAENVPEGALTPDLRFNMPDSLEPGQPLDFSVAFRNIGLTAFDSLRLYMTVTGSDNVVRVVPLPKTRPLAAGDTLHVAGRADTRGIKGEATVYLHVNPGPDQPEQLLFNNFLYRKIKVGADGLNPTLDVTFDGAHILDGDIVSSRPLISISMKDDSRFLLLDDTALIRVQVRFPDGMLRVFRVDGDTMRFSPASAAPNTDNTAVIDLQAAFSQDGEYELIVNGRDRSGNVAARSDLRVRFTVMNQAAISDLLNYPNPFTTSTAFVFTLTGHQPPRDLRIQILTVTGKIVREIRREELGPLRIGRNITEYRWDGTDQYGQPLANGVYLYRVIATQDGQSMERLKPEGDPTGKFFRNGYGKMYLMR
jgi:hypothetical protein